VWVMKQKGELTITRRTTGSSREEDCMSVEIKDASSGLLIARFSVSLAEMMLALTSLSCRPIEFDYLIKKEGHEKLGMTLETKAVFIEPPPSYDKDEQLEWVQNRFVESEECSGWELFSDGTRTQQPGKMHRIVVRRWV